MSLPLVWEKPEPVLGVPQLRDYVNREFSTIQTLFDYRSASR